MTGKETGSEKGQSSTDETENGAVLEHAAGIKTPAAINTTCPKEEEQQREVLCFDRGNSN